MVKRLHISKYVLLKYDCFSIKKWRLNNIFGDAILSTPFLLMIVALNSHQNIPLLIFLDVAIIVSLCLCCLDLNHTIHPHPMHHLILWISMCFHRQCKRGTQWEWPNTTGGNSDRHCQSPNASSSNRHHCGIHCHECH